MIINSKFSSLYLGGNDKWKAPFDRDACFLHKYAVGEEMRIQFIGYTIPILAKYTDSSGDETPLIVQQINSGTGDGRLFEIVFSVNNTGIYELNIGSDMDNVISYFQISNYSDLKDSTILLNYTHRKDDYDTIFSDRRFNFRIPGGIYPGDRRQAIDNSTFRDQRFIQHQTASESYEISVLTAGEPYGVPQWAGNRINNIFKLSDVTVNGIDTRRNESSTPEIIQIADNYPLYVYKMNVEQPDDERIYPNTDHPFVPPEPPIPGNGDFNIDFNIDFLK